MRFSYLCPVMSGFGFNKVILRGTRGLAGTPVPAGITCFTFSPMYRKRKKELDFQWDGAVKR